MKRIAIAAAVLLAAACTPRSDQDGQAKGSNPNATGPVATSRLPERYTIVTRLSGAATGTSVQHVRDGGRRMAIIEDRTLLTTVGVRDRMHTRTIAEPADEGLRTIIIDLETGEVTSTTMPNQDVSQMTSAGQQMWSRGRQTGERGTFAGQGCEYWELAEPSMRFCVSAFGLPLHTRTQIAGMTMETTVTELRLGDGGPDSAFAYDASRVVEAPNIQDMMDEMVGK
jgi:hypothetical protein